MQKLQLRKGKINVIFYFLIYIPTFAIADTINVSNRIIDLKSILFILEEHHLTEPAVFMDDFKTTLVFTNIKDTIKAIRTFKGDNQCYFIEVNNRYFECTEYRESIKISTQYIDKKSYLKDSVQIEYHDNGNIKIRQFWKQGNLVGICQQWDSSGKKIFEAIVCDDKFYDGVCNCMAVINCLGWGISICYADEWYTSGDIKYKLIRNNHDKNYVYVHYSKNGEILDQTKLKVGIVKDCIPMDEGEQFGVYFLVPY